VVTRKSTLWTAEYNDKALGNRMTKTVKQPLEYAYLFGAVCLATGDTEALIDPIMSMDDMEKHLSLIFQKETG
jgi:hypothetical protein